MRVKLLFLALLFGAFLVSCEKKLEKNTFSDRQSSIVNNRELKGGKITSTLYPVSDKAQIISGNGSKELSSVSIEFPPGALKIPTDITLEEGIPTKIKDVQNDLKFSDKETIESKGKPVVVTSSSSEDLIVPMVISINIPNSTALKLAEGSLNYVIRYQIFKNSDKKSYSGFIPTKELDINESLVKFSTKYFGKFELFEVSKIVEKSEIVEKEIPKTDMAIKQIELESINNVMPNNDETIVLNGKNFHNGMVVTVGSAIASNYVINSESSINLVIPTGTKFGLNEIKVSNNLGSSSLNLFARSTLSDLPLISLEPEEVCSGIEYYDRSGTKRTGVLSCGEEEKPNCSESGQEGCITTAEVTALVKAEISSEDIKNGVSIAGISGSYSPDFPDPVNLRSNDTSNGVAGTISNCSAGGETGCLTDSTFKSVNVSSISSKIKSGESIAGVSGSYVPDFPNPVNVRNNDTTDGVSGTISDCSSNG